MRFPFCHAGRGAARFAGSAEAGREASPPARWKIKEILFCFGMNPRGFEVLGGICWPGKGFSSSFSLSRISKPRHWDKSKKRVPV